MNLLISIFIGISLSLDAFSVCLLYGTLNFNKFKNFFISFIIGIFHLFMPLIGLQLGVNILKYIHAGHKIVMCIIFIILGIEMIVSAKDEKDVIDIKTIGIIILGLTVSIDSMFVGITLDEFSSNIFLSSVIFSICSFLFSYLALCIGSYLSNKIGKYSNVIGGIILILIALISM